MYENGVYIIFPVTFFYFYVNFVKTLDFFFNFVDDLQGIRLIQV